MTRVAAVVAGGLLVAHAAPAAKARAQSAQSGAPIGQWLLELRAGDPNVRASAACSLGELGERADEAVGPLVDLLSDESRVTVDPCGTDRGPHWEDDLTVGEVAAVSLARIKGHAVDGLIGALGRPEPAARRNAAFGLGLTGDSRVVEPLARALGDASPSVRGKAAWSLGLQGDDRAVLPLTGALRDEDGDVRSQAAWALGLKGDRRAVLPLVEALDDSSPGVRAQAAWALGLKGDDRAIEPLMARLADESPSAAAQAAWALGLKGDQRALDQLRVALRSKSAEVRQQSAWAIGMISLRGAP
jgi:HEAT repeat protein